MKGATKVKRGSAAAEPQTHRRRPVHGRWWLIWTVVVLTAGTLIYLAALRVRQAVYLARLPVIPELSSHQAAVLVHLSEADRAARANPTSADLVGGLGLAYHADMFYEHAERCYAIAEALSRSTWRWTYYRALAQDARGDAEGLVLALRKVVAVAPGFSPAWWRLGEAEFKAGRYDRAEEAWRHVLPLAEPARPVPNAGWPARTAIAPVAAYARLGLARIALARNEIDRAREVLEEVTAKSPRFGPAFRQLGSAYSSLKRPQDAEKAVRTADQLPAYDPYFDPMIDGLVQQSRSSTFLLQQAAAADLSTNAAWREHLIRRALEFDPSNTDALFELASVLRVLRRFDEALQILERHQRLVPGDFQVLADIGRCLSGLKRLPEAEAVLRRALDGQNDANTHYDLGFVLDRVGRLDEAVAEYQRALALNPNHKDALNNLGVDLAGQGKMNEAGRQFEKLIALDPENADAHTNFAVVLTAQGARARAAQEFRKALEVNPAYDRARDGLRQLER